MDGTGSSAPAADGTWTTGEAAAYLNGGGVDFRITPKAVRQMADDPGNQVTAVRGGGGQWRRVLVSTVRAERSRILAEAGRVDPDCPASAAE